MANLINFNINQLDKMIVCVHIMDVIIFQKMVTGIYLLLKGHCIEFKYYADGIHSGLTPPGNNS